MSTGKIANISLSSNIKTSSLRQGGRKRVEPVQLPRPFGNEDEVDDVPLPVKESEAVDHSVHHLPSNGQSRVSPSSKEPLLSEPKPEIASQTASHPSTLARSLDTYRNRAAKTDSMERTNVFLTLDLKEQVEAIGTTLQRRKKRRRRLAPNELTDERITGNTVIRSMLEAALQRFTLDDEAFVDNQDELTELIGSWLDRRTR